MRKLLVAACLCASSGLNLGDPALAQNTTGRVIATCGSVSPLFNVGNPGPFTIDVNGVLCTSSGGGGSSVTQGTTPWIVDANNGSNLLNAINSGVGATSAAVPSTALYFGVNIGGNLVGPTGATRGSQQAISTQIVDGFGNQITAFGTAWANTNKVIPWDGTNNVTVKPASTAPVATDTSFVTALNPNSPGIITLGQTTKAGSAPVVFASDQLGGATVAASVPTIATSPYPVNSVGAAVPVTSSSGNVAASSAVATLAAAASKSTYISGFQATGSGATLGSCVNVTVAGVIGGTMTYTFCAAAGVLVSDAPLIVSFNPPLQSSAVNTAIVVTMPSLGTGNTNAAVNAQGYQL